MYMLQTFIVRSYRLYLNTLGILEVLDEKITCQIAWKFTGSAYSVSLCVLCIREMRVKICSGQEIANADVDEWVTALAQTFFFQ